MPHYNSLDSCVSSLSASVELLDDALSALDDATHDVPRIKTVMTTNKVFGLVPSVDLENAKRDIHTEIKPRVQAMVELAGKRLEEARREHSNLAKKAALQQMRLRDVDVAGAREPMRVLHQDAEKLARLRLLQDKKDRLRQSLSRLQLQERRNRIGR
ncbi:DASH complex subunit SPC19 [Meyerozyma sp. JA9]|nr:DASH complex subunit SPC19 [Meyerozyma sp. JA9]